MGRAPCCEKMGLKKGPWTPEEDQVLINYINQNGHSNWRALPKHAGLLRCGKSCRLRWTNYLRPDIKRGNFTLEEEETIIKLHEMLGNRWSAIAASLPGRTDNEIKNVWHTHLKKRLPKLDSTSGPVVGPTRKRARKPKAIKKEEILDDNSNSDSNDDAARCTRPKTSDPVSPQPCTSEASTLTSSTSSSENDTRHKENVGNQSGYFGEFTEINDDFWMEVLSVEDTAMSSEDLPSASQYDQKTSSSPLLEESLFFESSSKVNVDDMDFFWRNLLTRSDELPEFSEML